MSFDPAAIRAFEYAGWQRAAGDYDATFAHASRRFVEALLDAAGVTAGVELLDLCCGTGVASGAAAGCGARVTGLDFSAAMLAEAGRTHPQLRFELGDAEALPFADESFDAVVSNFGIHHVPRPALALGEAFRVLRRRGRIALATWATPADNIAWQLVFDAIRNRGEPNAAAGAPPSGGGLVSREVVLRLLAAAGFSDCHAEFVRREWQVREPAELVDALARGTVRTAALIAAQPAAARPAILAAIAAAAAPYRRSGSYAVPIMAILGSGTKSSR